jgi:hypothetical protein
MARAKTAPFQIRFEVGLTNGSTNITTPDLSMYVDPVNRQALLVRQVDFIWTDSVNFLPIAFNADCEAAIQVHDSTLGGMFSLTSAHQVASGSLYYDATGILTNDQDFFPDTMGRSMGGGRIIVNDSLEVCARVDAGIPANSIVTCVMECEVVKLSEKDYIALALQTVADN